MAPGEVVAVAGPPGFGGTSVARLIAGIVVPESGHVRIGGADVTDLPPDRRPVGLVPVGGGLLPHLTTEANITYGLHLRKLPSAVVRHRIAEVAERLDLLPSLQLRPHELSAGQRMRAALARAVVRRVQVVTIDATAGARGAGQLRRLVERGWPGVPMSVVLCTGDPAVAGQADRVVVVRDGRAGPSGSLDDLRAAPPDLATARLVLPEPAVELTGDVRGGTVEFGPLAVPAPSGVPDGGRVVALAPGGALRLRTADSGLCATVVVAPAGPTAPAVIEPQAWPGTRWSVRAPVGALPRPGDRVGVELDADRLLFFDAEAAGAPLLVVPEAGMAAP